MRVATYTRISTHEEHQPYSLEAQEQRLAAYVASQDGWELCRRYSDRMTGSTLERPELQRAIADARLHRYDLLLVYRVDRLSRSVRGLAQILDELDQARVLFRSATEPFDTGTPAGRMMVQMLGVFAEFERATLVDRVIAGMERQERLKRESLAQPEAGVLANLRTAIADALEAGPGSQRKALLQELVSEIRVESRESILPTYRLPLAPVRVMSGMVGGGGLEPPTSALVCVERCAAKSGGPSVAGGVMWREECSRARD